MSDTVSICCGPVYRFDAIGAAVADFPRCLRRKEARQLCAKLGVKKRTFLAWCTDPPAMPEGMVFRHKPGRRKLNLYSREGIVWLSQAVKSGENIERSEATQPNTIISN